MLYFILYFWWLSPSSSAMCERSCLPFIHVVFANYLRIKKVNKYMSCWEYSCATQNCTDTRATENNHPFKMQYEFGFHHDIAYQLKETYRISSYNDSVSPHIFSTLLICTIFVNDMLLLLLPFLFNDLNVHVCGCACVCECVFVCAHAFVLCIVIYTSCGDDKQQLGTPS